MQKKKILLIYLYLQMITVITVVTGDIEIHESETQLLLTLI